MTDSSPRFAIDRCLAKRVPAMLAERGWNLVSIYDVFPDDAEHIPDEDWIKWANDHVDGALTKDEQIRRSPSLLVAMLPIFGLSRQDLGYEEMVRLFDMNRRHIERIATSCPGRQFWTIYRSGDMRRTDVGSDGRR